MVILKRKNARRAWVKENLMELKKEMTCSEVPNKQWGTLINFSILCVVKYYRKNASLTAEDVQKRIVWIKRNGAWA